MRIAVVTGVDKPTTVDSKGGTEVWAANFVIESAERGHKIDLYASQGSVSGPNINLIPTIKEPLPDYYSEKYFTDPPEQFLFRKERFFAGIYTRVLTEIIRKESDYDVVIDSVFHPSFSLNVNAIRKPVVAVGHFPADVVLQFYAQEFGWPKNSIMIFPSQYQYKNASFLELSQKMVIPHGMRIPPFVFSETGGASILWLGRVHHGLTDKGVEEAMIIAQKLGRRMRVVCTVEPLPEERSYFENVILPLATADIVIDEQHLNIPTDKNTAYGDAKLFLLPLKWEEPFGLVMIEAMACGTPIVAYARGSVPEIVIDGKTGFVVNSSDTDVRGDFLTKTTGEAGLREAVERIYAMSTEEYAQMRKNCRVRVEQNFTLQRMVNEYEQLFLKLKS